MNNINSGRVQGATCPFTDMNKGPEDKNYILMYTGCVDGEEIKSFEVITGRENMYKFIMDTAKDLYLVESVVLVEDATPNDAITAYGFMLAMEGKYEYTFDVRDYVDGDVEVNDDNIDISYMKTDQGVI